MLYIVGRLIMTCTRFGMLNIYCCTWLGMLNNYVCAWFDTVNKYVCALLDIVDNYVARGWTVLIIVCTWVDRFKRYC